MHLHVAFDDCNFRTFQSNTLMILSFNNTYVMTILYFPMLAMYFEIEIRVQRHMHWLVLVSHSRQSLASYWYKREVWHLPWEFWQKADAVSCLWKWQEVNAAKNTRSQGAEVPCVLILSLGFRGQGPLAACVYQTLFEVPFLESSCRTKTWDEKKDWKRCWLRLLE